MENRINNVISIYKTKKYNRYLVQKQIYTFSLMMILMSAYIIFINHYNDFIIRIIVFLCILFLFLFLEVKNPKLHFFTNDKKIKNNNTIFKTSLFEYNKLIFYTTHISDDVTHDIHIFDICGDYIDTVFHKKYGTKSNTKIKEVIFNHILTYIADDPNYLPNGYKPFAIIKKNVNWYAIYKDEECGLPIRCKSYDIGDNSSEYVKWFILNFNKVSDTIYISNDVNRDEDNTTQLPQIEYICNFGNSPIYYNTELDIVGRLIRVL